MSRVEIKRLLINIPRGPVRPSRAEHGAPARPPCGSATTGAGGHGTACIIQAGGLFCVCRRGEDCGVKYFIANAVLRG
jgi:hypothetical protein